LEEEKSDQVPFVFWRLGGMKKIEQKENRMATFIVFFP
jgi:hypothetical protein